ncbi:MAG: Adenine DNA glycosylase [Holosporales bacterium]
MHDKLLHWYDKNRRTLPWRAEPGEIPNPYYVYLSEILLQQTTVATVKSYFLNFIEKWPTLKDFAKADLDDVLHTFQGLGYYSRAKNLAKSAKFIHELGYFPSDYKKLSDFPGIGDYTAKAIASIAFNQPVVPIDGNVIRVFSRYFGLTTPLPFLKKDILYQTEKIGAGPRPGDFAQSLMDLGSLICKPKNPDCMNCPLNKECVAYHQKLDLPNRPEKIAKPKKLAIAHIYYNKQFILFEKAKESGLLAHLWGVPLSDCTQNPPVGEPIAVTHVFTHFHLSVYLHVTFVDDFENFSLSANQKIILKEDIGTYATSTLMKKILKSFTSFPCLLF